MDKNDSNLNDYYKDKYIKYKTKYLELKKNQSGGGGWSSMAKSAGQSALDFAKKNPQLTAALLSSAAAAGMSKIPPEYQETFKQTIQYPQQYPQTQYPQTQYPQAQYPQAQQHPQAQYPQTQYPQAQYPQAQYPQAQYPQAQHPQAQQYPQTQDSRKI